MTLLELSSEGPAPCPGRVSPHQSLEAPGGCAQAGPMGPTFHMVLLLQLDPTKVGDSPHGDVEALGHAHLEAVKVHLELDRYRCEPASGASTHPPLARPAPPGTAGPQGLGAEAEGSPVLGLWVAGPQDRL